MSGRVSAPHPGGLGTARLELPVKLDSRLHVKGGTSLKGERTSSYDSTAPCERLGTRFTSINRHVDS